jgi:superfamily II DNA helicase RecQ
MNIRVVTLRYSETLGGFPEEPLRQVLAGGNVVEQREYFFTHGGVPHLTLVLVMDNSPNGRPSGQTYPRDREDPGDKLPEHLQPLYRSLRQWRNDRAKQVGVPSYVIMRNVQLAEICRKLPRTLAALKAIGGVGEATTAKYGQEILGQLLPGRDRPLDQGGPPGAGLRAVHGRPGRVER